MESRKRKELKFQRSDLHLNESSIHKVLENGLAITPERKISCGFSLGFVSAQLNIANDLDKG